VHSLPSILGARLERQRELGLERLVSLPRGIDFCSNDYFGFSADLELHKRVCEATQNISIGATGSRLLRGHTEIHQRAELALAQFCRAETTLLYPSGYQANVGLLSAVLASADRVYSDELNHASIIDGIRLSGCVKRIYRHADLSHLESLLREDEGTSGLKVIMTESLFSMEGDVAPLRDIAALAQQYRAELIVDEAHATGLFGSGLASSLGLSEHVLATIHTGGKALGISGAWIAGSNRLKEFLLNFSRSQIFSTAISPWLAASLETSVAYHDEVGRERTDDLHKKIRRFRNKADIGPEHLRSPIISWRVGTPQKALESAAALQSQGFDARAIRPPTVPEESCRLRITIKWTNTDSEIDGLASALLKLRSVS
jgi:8-amino-7-oxononanoate synthase